jgi:hypothetical protein
VSAGVEQVAVAEEEADLGRIVVDELLVAHVVEGDVERLGCDVMQRRATTRAQAKLQQVTTVT